MKNYILFIIDSLNYSHVKNSSIELMPFLSKLKEEGISCENMYSQAPYTEAAVMNLYCGQDVLQDGGYLFRFKNAQKTIFEVMAENGYTTYFNSFQPQCHPSSVRRGVSDIYYNVGYDLGALWAYRLSHYSELYKKGELSEQDYDTLLEIFSDNFKEWLRFADDIINDDKSVEFIKGNDKNYSAIEVKKAVKEQYDIFNNNPREYINVILQEGTTHPLFSIPAYVQHNKIRDREIPDFVRDEYDPLFKRIQKMNRKLNLKNCKDIGRGPIKKLGAFIKHPNRLTYKEFGKSVLLSANAIRDLDLFHRIEKDCDWFKNAPSGRKHIDHYINWARKRGDEKPHFACIHIDDIHNPEEFFTYDSKDKELLKKEKADAEALLDKIPSDYYGSLTHDLSLNYIDNVIKYLYESLEKEGMLENTCITICADHGFSFSGNPLRDSFVINLYLENYNIPCVITGAGREGLNIKKLCTSKDVPATICELATGSVPKEFSGHSILSDYEYDSIGIEYCGGGCPDLSRRELKIASFDGDCFVGTLCKLDDDINEKTITEVYNLTKDPIQLKNMAGKIKDFSSYNKYIDAIIERKKEIKRTMKL